MEDRIDVVVLEADADCRIIGRRVEAISSGTIYASALLQLDRDARTDPDGSLWVYSTVVSCAEDEGLILARSGEGRLLGALTHTMKPDGDGMIEVIRLGVNRKHRGLGTALMREAARIAIQGNNGLCVYSRPGSEAFFRALAMRPRGRQEIRKFTDNYYFSFSPEETRIFAER